MRLLALNPFHGGSHRAFLEGWMRHTRHEFTPLTLPDRHWKWRMRSAAVAFAEQLRSIPRDAAPFDAVFVTDMLNLAELRGLCGTDLARLPGVLYFHENQLTYPSRERGTCDRDLHFAVTNIVSALAAEAVWFNSAFHRDVFLAAVDDFARRMPDPSLKTAAGTIRSRSAVCPPGVDAFPHRTAVAAESPVHLLWAARWEHDKQPELFFDAIERAAAAGCEFRVIVIGQSYSEVPACFSDARDRFADRIVHWGYLKSRHEYRNALMSADVFVSTAAHEFFGIAAAEAIAAGCYPLLPDRLAYPELVAGRSEFLYPGDAPSLSTRMIELADRRRRSESLYQAAAAARRAVSRFEWPRIAAAMDDRIDEIVIRHRKGSSGF